VAALDPSELRRAAKAPASEVAAASKLASLRRSQRATKADVLPGDLEGQDAVPFVWRLLDGNEKQLARARAVARMRAIDIPIELMFAAPDLEDECAWQILAIAMRNPDEVGNDPRNPYPEPLAADVAELRELLTTDERDLLITRYMDFEEELDPDPADLPPEQLAAIVALVKKKREESLGRLMNSGTRTLARCVIALVDQLSSSASGSSSNTTPSS
jgi:hypothetical protein